VVFGEAHARAGGDRITQLLELVGIDVYGLALDGLFGSTASAVPRASAVAAVRYFRFPVGRLERIDGTHQLAHASDVAYWRLDVQPGDQIAPVLHSFARHGCLVVVGQTVAETRLRADALRDSVRVQVTSYVEAVA
jgi:hypothetical protein